MRPRWMRRDRVASGLGNDLVRKVRAALEAELRTALEVELVQ